MLSLSRQSLWLPCALGHGNLLERAPEGPAVYPTALGRAPLPTYSLVAWGQPILKGTVERVNTKLRRTRFGKVRAQISEIDSAVVRVVLHHPTHVVIRLLEVDPIQV
jgi:hypothetical protein